MGVLDGTMSANYDLTAELDRYSELSDKVRAGKISKIERDEFKSMRKRLAI